MNEGLKSQRQQIKEEHAQDTPEQKRADEFNMAADQIRDSMDEARSELGLPESIVDEVLQEAKKLQDPQYHEPDFKEDEKNLKAEAAEIVADTIRDTIFRFGLTEDELEKVLSAVKQNAEHAA